MHLWDYVILYKHICLHMHLHHNDTRPQKKNLICKSRCRFHTYHSNEEKSCRDKPVGETNMNKVAVSDRQKLLDGWTVTRHEHVMVARGRQVLEFF